MRLDYTRQQSMIFFVYECFEKGSTKLQKGSLTGNVS